MEEITDLLKTTLIEIDIIYFQRNERDFTYEVYHKIRETVLNDGIEITAETPKSGHKIPKELLEDDFFIKYFFNKNNFDFENGKFSRTPDLLFHEYINRNQQLVAFEVKNAFENLTKIKVDLAKLAFYNRGPLKYKKCILLLYSNNNRVSDIYIQEIKDFLKRYPEIEIWIVKPQTKIEIICSKSF